MPSSACDWSSDVCSSDRSEEHTSELQSRSDLVCRLLLEKKKKTIALHDDPAAPAALAHTIQPCQRSLLREHVPITGHATRNLKSTQPTTRHEHMHYAAFP